MFDDNFVSLNPVNFFQLSVNCPHRARNAKVPLEKSPANLLSDTSSLCNEESFAKIWLGWSREGIEAFAAINEPYRQSVYPDVTAGDCVELFIDTRDVKTSGFNTRFCHHFFFLPEAVDGHIAGEITRFRSEDMHELCDPVDLKVTSQMKAGSYTMHIFIPNQCLCGYDPDQFDRMGFTYRINRGGGEPQHFSAVTDEYQIEQQPSLWSSVKLIK